MNKSILQIALASTLLAGVAQAAPFQNGSFEIGPAPGATFITLGAGDTSITGWEVTGAGIDYIGGLWQPADGNRSLDLSATAAGGIQQTFDTVAGHNYQVTFSLAGNPSTPPPGQDRPGAGNGGRGHQLHLRHQLLQPRRHALGPADLHLHRHGRSHHAELYQPGQHRPGPRRWTTSSSPT